MPWMWRGLGDRPDRLRCACEPVVSGFMFSTAARSAPRSGRAGSVRSAGRGRSAWAAACVREDRDGGASWWRGTGSPIHLPGLGMSWRSSEKAARAGAVGDDGGEAVGLRGRLEHQLAADGEADPADPVRVDVRPVLRGSRRPRRCPSRRPSRRGCGRRRWRLRRAGRRAGRRSRARRASGRAAWGPRRPGNAITAAPFFEGMYQPSSRRPSLVVKDTSS